MNASSDFSQVQLVAFKKRVAFTTTLDRVVEQHGWAGALDFEGCKEILKDCLFDDKEEEVRGGGVRGCGSVHDRTFPSIDLFLACKPSSHALCPVALVLL